VYHATNYLYKTSAFLHFCIGNVSVILISNSSEFDGIKNQFRDAKKKVEGRSGRWDFGTRREAFCVRVSPLIASPDYNAHWSPYGVSFGQGFTEDPPENWHSPSESNGASKIWSLARLPWNIGLQLSYQGFLYNWQLLFIY
jgi:hypothetical protein